MEDVADYSIKKARENLTKWEDLNNPIAPINAEGRETIIELMSIANNRCFSSSVHELKVSTESSDFLSSENSQKDTSPYKVQDSLQSSSKFLGWFREYGDEISESSHSNVMHDYISQLKKHQSECQALLQQLDMALNHLNTLHGQYTSVSTRTTALHTDCEHLLAEQNRLSNTADLIQAKLWYFTQVEGITQKLTSPAFSVTSDSFIPLLSKIDQCIAYMKNNPNYKESSVYLVRYMHCLSRALGLIRVYVTKSLENATKQVIPKADESKPNSDNATILYYSKFRTNAPRIKALMSEIENRIVDVRSSLASADALNSSDTSVQNNNERSLSNLYTKPETSDQEAHLQEYQNLLQDCHQCYFQQRQTLLGPSVNDAVSQLLNNYRKDHCSLVRSGCAFLVHVCEDEHNLFNQFFSLPSPLLDSFLEGLCLSLYDGLRPLIIHIDHLETLSELCGILRRGMIEEHLQSNPRQLNALRSVVTRMLEDTQERLVYRAHVYINSDIAGFVASPGDLAYPSKLELMEQIAREIAASRRLSASRMHNRTPSDASIVSVTSESVYSTTGGERFSRVGSSPADLHGMWYPTLRRTLMCLSKLYRCVDKAIFQGVSLEAIAACIDSLNSAAAAISSSSSPTHASLFQIKHLLILREQLAPFQVESSLKETSLDWSKLKGAALELVQHRANFFSLSSNNALLQFIVDGVPNVTEQLMDSKKDVDNELKKVCEKLIQNSTEALVGQLTSFLAKADVIIAMNKRENEVKPITLKNQPFATPDKISELVLDVNRTIRSKLPKLQRNLHLYLANRDTEYILLKPIRINVANSFAKLNNMISLHYSAEEALIASCPNVDEVNITINALLEAQEKKMSEGGAANEDGAKSPKGSLAATEGLKTDESIKSNGTEGSAPIPLTSS